MSKIHTLKTWPEFYSRVASGEKPFEVRKDDRDFQVGDVLTLQEWSPASQDYTGEMVSRRVTYKLTGGSFGVETGHCVLGLAALIPGGKP